MCHLTWFAFSTMNIPNAIKGMVQSDASARRQSFTNIITSTPIMVRVLLLRK